MKPSVLKALCLCSVLAMAAPGCSDDAAPARDSGPADIKVADGPRRDARDLTQPDSKSTGDAAPSSIKADLRAFVVALAGKLDGSASPAKVETYVPSGTDAAGWTEDLSKGKPGVEAAYTDAAINLLINGTHAPYEAAGCSGFALQYFQKGNNRLMLYLWQMKASASAKKLHDDKKDYDEKYTGLTFETVAGAADLASMADDSPEWKVYGYRGRHTYKIIATEGM